MLSMNFDPEVTIEEISGDGRHPRFDAAINENDDESIQVICKRGTEEIPLANPARAVYFVGWRTGRRALSV